MAKTGAVETTPFGAEPKVALSNTTIIGREVEMFRCHFNPMLTPTARQAFMPKDYGMKAIIADMGVHVTLASGVEHLVPYANIESLRLVKI